MIEILQIIPAAPDDRIAWYNEGLVCFTVPVCLALVKQGLKEKEVVYMETVDNEIKIVDTEDENFMGFVNKQEKDSIDQLRKEASDRAEKENGKPK